MADAISLLVSRPPSRVRPCRSSREPLPLATRRYALSALIILWPHNGRNLAAVTEISSGLLRCRFPAQGTNNPLISVSEEGYCPFATAIFAFWLISRSAGYPDPANGERGRAVELQIASTGLPDVRPVTVRDAAVAVTDCVYCGYPTLGAQICAYCQPTLARPGTTLW